MVRRNDLLTVMETCEVHHKVAMLPPAEQLVRQLVEDVFRNSVSAFLFLVGFCFIILLLIGPNVPWSIHSAIIISLQVDHVSVSENGSPLTDRSQIVRDRLHSKMAVLAGYLFIQ